MKLSSKILEYREVFTLTDLQSPDNFEIIEPILSLRKWSVFFKKKENGKLLAGISWSKDEDISHPVIHGVKYKISGGRYAYDSGDLNFPSPSDSESNKTGLTHLTGYEIEIPANKDSMDVEVCLTFKDVEQQVKAVNRYLDSHPDTIGHLTEEDLNELNDLRQTEMSFYSDENGTELIHTATVDLHAMAQWSKYIRGLLRFKRNNDDNLVQVPLKSEKLICKHFNEETITDLIAFTHGRQFKRSYFLDKSLDYLLRMGYICNQLLIESLHTMIDDCIFCYTKWDQMGGYVIESIKNSLKYALETCRFSLIKRLWELVTCMKLNPESEKYQQIRQTLKDGGGETLAVIADTSIQRP